MFHQSPSIYYFHHEIRIRLSDKSLTSGNIPYLSSCQVDFNNITGFSTIYSLNTLQKRQSDINSITEEDAGKALGNNTGDTRSFDSQGRMLPRRTTAEVGVSHNNVPRLNPGQEFGINVFHAMLSQLSRLGQIKMSSRYDSIGVKVSTIFMNLAFQLQIITYLSRLDT